MTRAAGASRPVRWHSRDVDIDRLVFGTGDRVSGWGWVRDTADGVWFDPGGWYARASDARLDY